MGTEALARGEAIFSPGIARRVLAYFGSGPRNGGGGLFPELTNREREVLDLLARGVNNQVIAERLGLTSKTVRNHVSNIFNKLHVTDRAQAIVRAREAGLGGPTTIAPQMNE